MKTLTKKTVGKESSKDTVNPTQSSYLQQIIALKGIMERVVNDMQKSYKSSSSSPTKNPVNDAQKAGKDFEKVIESVQRLCNMGLSSRFDELLEKPIEKHETSDIFVK